MIGPMSGDSTTLSLPLKEADPVGEVVVRGEVERVTFRNPTNGYSVIQLTISDRRETVTVVGNCLAAEVGAHLLVRGEFRAHPKFGRQLTATSITPSEPSTAEGLERYLGSGMIKGIGEKTAQKLVELYGTDVIEQIANNPLEVAKASGIGKKRIKLLSAWLQGHRESRDVMRFMVENKLSPNMATKIYERYGTRAVEILKKDPYMLARDVRGIGFLTADTIAMNLGLSPEAPQRLKAGLYHALERAADEGHCYLKAQVLLSRSQVLLRIEPHIDLSPFLEELIAEQYIVQREDGYFLRHLARAEDIVARFIAERCAPREAPFIATSIVETSLSSAAEELKLSFSSEQVQAVHDATNHRLLVITGGPGCGKTTIIRALTKIFKNANRRLLLAAPTGRAAQRMAQVCSVEACTIHRLLKYNPHKARFLYGHEQPLPTDALIIDETSMLDITLARDLFLAIPRDATLILVGDKDQLPSVGPGRVFADLVALQAVKTVSLSRLFRRDEESSINSVAHTINAGGVPAIPQPDGVVKGDAYFIPKLDPEAAATMIEKLVADQLPRKFGFQADQIAVLTPTNRGALGTLELNKRLQAALNPPGSIDVEQEIVLDDVIFRVGDRVCQRVNNYKIDDHGVFNGDVGKIYSIERRTQSMVVELWDGRLLRYDRGLLGQLSLAYAVTVHRSQGSEFPCVVLALHDSQFMLLERQLIYTAVTRAKRLLVVVGSPRALALACKRMSGIRRLTMLQDRILALAAGDAAPTFSCAPNDFSSDL